MKLKLWHYLILGLLTGLLLAVLWAVLSNNKTVAPTVNNSNQTPNINAPANGNDDTNATNTNQPLVDTAAFSTSDLPDRDPKFDFSAKLPTGWAAEYVAGSRAINFFDPKASGDSNLNQSQIFVTYFEASDFQTLSTVNVKSQTTTTINGQSAVTYVIEKKSGVADFADQPSWRNAEHRVTDIRSTDASPTIFYVFAKAPAVADAIFNDLLNSVSFADQASQAPLVYPLKNFVARVTKKPFGIFITPKTSPVQPEKFSGFHTGADAETTAAEADQDIPVYAIADGTVVLARRVSGYGGVMMIAQTVDGQTVTALYGHLRQSSFQFAVGGHVKVAKQIAVLGTGYSTETDGERKHLHLGLLVGPSQNLRGYVSSASTLSGWYNPLTWLTEHSAKEISV